MTEPMPPAVNLLHGGDFADYRPDLADNSMVAGELPTELMPWEDHPEPPAPPEPRRPWQFGLIALGIAILLVIGEIIAISMAAAGQFTPATVLGQILIALTALPLALGILAIVRHRGIGMGIAAIVLAIAANPFVQISLFTFFGTL